MTPTNSGHTNSALAVFKQTFWSRLRGRFRKGDAVHIPLVGTTLGLAMVFGAWAVAHALGAPNTESPSVASVFQSILVGIGLAFVLAAMQVWQGGVGIRSTLAAWAVILVAAAVGVWPGRHERYLLANMVVLALSTLGAALWLHQRRRSAGSPVHPPGIAP